MARRLETTPSNPNWLQWSASPFGNVSTRLRKGVCDWRYNRDRSAFAQLAIDFANPYHPGGANRTPGTRAIFPLATACASGSLGSPEVCANLWIDQAQLAVWNCRIRRQFAEDLARGGCRNCRQLGCGAVLPKGCVFFVRGTGRRSRRRIFLLALPHSPTGSSFYRSGSRAHGLAHSARPAGLRHILGFCPDRRASIFGGLFVFTSD
jgi:hypothetical protein